MCGSGGASRFGQWAGIASGVCVVWGVGDLMRALEQGLVGSLFLGLPLRDDGLGVWEQRCVALWSVGKG